MWIKVVLPGLIENFLKGFRKEVGGWGVGGKWVVACDKVDKTACIHKIKQAHIRM